MQPRILVAAIAATLSLAAPAHAATTPVQRAAATVSKRATHTPGATHGERLANALSLYVAQTLNPVRYDHLRVKPTTVDAALTMRAGICGNQVATALAIADTLRLKARPVELYYARHGMRWSHIMLETWDQGGWRLHDVTFGAVYRSRYTHRLLSYAQLHRKPPAERARLRELTPYNVSRDRYHAVGADPFTYAIADADVVTGGVGTVRMARHGREYPAVPDIPNYVGTSVSYGTRLSHLSLRLDDVRSTSIVVHVTGVGCAVGMLVARSGIMSSATVTGPGDMTLAVKGPRVVLSVPGACYFVLGGVDA